MKPMLLALVFLWTASNASSYYTVFVSQQGMDFASCGDVSSPCGTLYQASVLVNAWVNALDATNGSEVELASINVVGQNQTEIARHLSPGDTNGYDPCLPMPFSAESAVEINFDALLINEMRDWYPLSVCPGTNTMYLNEFLFQGGRHLTLNRLMIDAYTITDDEYYPLIRGSQGFPDTFIVCNDCVFRDIVSTVADSERALVYGILSVSMHNTEWTNVECATGLIWTQAYGYEEADANRMVMVTNSVFTNIRASLYVLYGNGLTLNSSSLVISDCVFTEIRTGVSLVFEEDWGQVVDVRNTTFDVKSGSVFLSFHVLDSEMYFADVEIAIAADMHLWSDSEYALILVGSSDVVTMSTVSVTYTYNVSANCWFFTNHSNAWQSWQEWKCRNPIAVFENSGELLLQDWELDVVWTSPLDESRFVINHKFEVQQGGYGQSSLFVNFGLLTIDNFYFGQTMGAYMFKNFGETNIYNLNMFYDEETYSPNKMATGAVLTTFAGAGVAVMSVDASHFIGFKQWAAMSFGANTLVVSNTLFEVGAHPVVVAHATVSVINCTFRRVGPQYFGQLLADDYLAVQSTAPLWLVLSPLAVVQGNDISGFDPMGLLLLYGGIEIHISDNRFMLDTSGTMYPLPADAQYIIDGKSPITFLGTSGPTEVVGNEFGGNDFHQSKHWLLYLNAPGDHCTAGNKFTNAAIAAVGTVVTSCFRPDLVKCIDIEYGECMNDIYGDMKLSMQDFQQEIVVSDVIDSIFDVSSGNLAMDHVQITSTAELQLETADPLVIKAVGGSVLLVDSSIGEGSDISYNPNECVIAHNKMLSDSVYVSKLQLDCSNQSDTSALSHSSLSVEQVDSLSAISIDVRVQSESSSYYPGQLLQFTYTVLDELDNVIDFTSAHDVVIRLHGSSDAFLTELTVEPSGECPQCQNGVLINLLQVNKHIGDTFTLEVSIVNELDQTWLLPVHSEIQLNITGCPEGKGPDENNSTCIKCNNGHFNLMSGNVQECLSCAPDANTGVECADGDIMVHQDHWMGFHKDTVSIISASCPERYCCQDSQCQYDEPVNHVVGVLCAQNRNSTSKLCGACNVGFSESMNSAKCVKCKRNFHFEFLLLPILWSVALTLLIFWFSSESPNKNAKKSDDKKEVAPPKSMCGALLKNGRFQFMIRTVIMKNIFYYEQGVTQILTTSSYAVLFRDMSAQFGLSLTSVVVDADEDDLWCFVDGLGGKGKIVIDLLVPLFVFIMVTIPFVVSRCILKKPLVFCSCCNKTQHINFGKAYITTVLITIAKVLDVLFKLMSCQRVGDGYVHYYFGYETCYATSWWLAFFSILIIVALFTLVFVHLKRMDEEKRQSRSNALNRFVSRYKPEYWYYEYCLFVRRIVIALFAVSVQDITGKFFFAAILLFFTWVQHKMNPFAVQESNDMEFILLCCLVLIQLTQISSLFNPIAINVVVSFLIVYPFLLLVYYVRRIYKTKINTTGAVGNSAILSSSDMDSDVDVDPPVVSGINRATSNSALDTDIGVELHATNHRPAGMNGSQEEQEEERTLK